MCHLHLQLLPLPIRLKRSVNLLKLKTLWTSLTYSEEIYFRNFILSTAILIGLGYFSTPALTLLIHWMRFIQCTIRDHKFICAPLPPNRCNFEFILYRDGMPLLLLPTIKLQNHIIKSYLVLDSEMRLTMTVNNEQRQHWIANVLIWKIQLIFDIDRRNEGYRTFMFNILFCWKRVLRKFVVMQFG